MEAQPQPSEPDSAEPHSSAPPSSEPQLPEPPSSEPQPSEPSTPAPGRSAGGEKLARAKELVGAGRVQDAIALYLEVLAADPNDLKAHNNLGVLLDELKQHTAALEHFAAADRIDPNNVEVLSNHAAVLTSLARFDEAEAVLRRAQQIAPEAPAVRLGLGILSFRRGTYGPAEADLAWVCEHDADNGPAHYYLGEALNRLGRFEEAEVALGRAADLMPADPRPFYTLGHLLDRRSMRVEATEMYRRARELQGG